MLQIRNNIKLIRSLSGKKQEDFIRLFPGVTVAMQKSYEGGKAKPDAAYIDAIARMAGVTANDVMHKELSGKDIKFKVEKVESPDFEALYIAELQSQKKALEEDKAFFKEMLRTSLAGLLQRTEEMWLRQKGTGDVVLHSLERLEKKEAGELIREADRRIIQIDKEESAPGNAHVPNR